MNFNIGGSAVGGNFGGGVYGCGALGYGAGAISDPFGAASLMSILNYDSNYFLWYGQKYGLPLPASVKTNGIRHHPYRLPLLQQNQKINLNSVGGYLGQQPPHLSLYPITPSVMPEAGQNPTEVMLDILRAQQQLLTAQYGYFSPSTQPLASVQQLHPSQPLPFDQHLYNFILQQQIFKANISVQQLKKQPPFQQNNNSRFIAPLKVGKPHSTKFPKSLFHQKTVTVPPSLAYSQANSLHLPYQQLPNANFGMVQTSMSELYFAGAAAKTKMNR